MDIEKKRIVEQIENVFKDLGGFSWEQAETWASFCFAVGMDPLPQLKVMMNNICDVSEAIDTDKASSKIDFPQLQLVKKGHRIRFNLVVPDND
jgi:hypothetical protein